VPDIAPASDDEIKNAISHIADQFVRGRLGFLFGSGMSFPSGGATAGPLSERLLLEGFFKHLRTAVPPEIKAETDRIARIYPLEGIATAALEQHGFGYAEATDLLKQHLFSRTPTLHEGHIALGAC
jgi:hypothetical protein